MSVYKNLLIILLLVNTSFSCSNPAQPENNDSGQDGDWKLVWQDEFNGEAVDGSRWNFELGASGWGNNEWQNYTARSQNAYILDSVLVIEARKENYEGSEYTSARMTTKNKGDWLYGRFEIRAKLPFGQGIWPAIWMLPTDWEYGGWAASGEIDIMELVGHEPSTVHGTLHYGDSWPGNVHTGTSFSLDNGRFADEYHLFALEWEPGEMRWYVDGELYATQDEWYSNSAPWPAPFDKRFHILLNVAVGGNWPGYPDETTQFPQRMYIDYVRVYERAGERPQITLEAKDGDTYEAGVPVTLEATVEHNANISEVAFFNGARKIATVNSAPFRYTWNDVPQGCLMVRARATDKNGMAQVSDILNLTVGSGCEQTPYNGEPFEVPGRVQCEAYDLGGQNVAYFDTTPLSNTGGAFRSDEGVDIERCSDAGGGYNVGWAENGEWLEYTIDVPQSGSYSITVRCAANQSGAQFRFYSGNNDLTGLVDIPSSGGWQNWQNVTTKTFSLEQGEQVLRLMVEAGGANYNYFEVNAQ